MKGFQGIIEEQQYQIKSYFEENKFDNYFFENENLILAIEGVILNKKEEFNALYPNDKSFFTLYKKWGNTFFTRLEGEFCGCIFEKQSRQFFTFTNYTGTRKVFYYYNNNTLIVDTHLSRLVNTLKEKKLPYSLDEFSVYSILVCINTLENHTPIQEVKKLRNAEFLNFNSGTKNPPSILSYNKIENSFKGTKTEALQCLEDLFSEAVKLEFEKDKELNKETFALLSGGLDSRMTVLLALKNKFPINEVFCFSQKKYWDEKIAQKIAEDYEIPFHFVPLNGGQYITQIDELLQISQGLISCEGGFHTHYAYQFIDKNRFGLIHSGQLGDGILGSLTKHPYPHPPTQEKIVCHSRFFHKIKEKFSEILKNYETEETFLLRNVGYNRAAMGSYQAEAFSYQVSPFMYSKFIRFALSLPEKWKFNEAIYIEWITKFHPEVAKYRWERTLLKPNSQIKTKIGDVVVKRIYNTWVNKILKRQDLGNMTAYEYYYHQEKQIKDSINKYFIENIEKVNDPKLETDLKIQFNRGSFSEKAAVLTVLSVIKNYF